MKAGIITVGTEILIGDILNTNSKYLSKKLSEIGIKVSHHISVRDDFKEIQAQIHLLIEKVNLLFICGGLGPTEDDLTKEALADYLSRDLVLDQYQYKKLIDRFKNRNKEMTPNNKKQAVVIEGSKLLDSNWGIVPGEIIEYKDKKIILLPGPPKEFENMVDFYLEEFFQIDSEIIIKSINTTGIGESNLEYQLRKLCLEEEGISLNTFSKEAGTEIKIIAEGKDKNIIRKKVQEKAKIIYENFSKYIYSEGNVGIEEALVKKLIDKDIKISFAESVTGGILASKIIAQPGASNILKNSVITYSDEAKNKILGVSKLTLEKYTAVSKEVAEEMAEGLHKIGFSNISVAITGEAGPKASVAPVGKVFVSYKTDKLSHTYEYNLSGDRNMIRERIAKIVVKDLLAMVEVL